MYIYIYIVTLPKTSIIALLDECSLEKCPAVTSELLCWLFTGAKPLLKEEMLLWWNEQFLGCRAEILCPPPVRPPGSSARSLGVLSVCKSTYPTLQLLKYRATTSAPELAAWSTGSRQCRKHVETLPQKASSSLENFLELFLNEKKVLSWYFLSQCWSQHNTGTINCFYLWFLYKDEKCISIKVFWERC